VLHFGYAGLFVVMALGNIGLPMGTEIVVPTAGALAAQGHFPPLGPIPGWVIVAIVATVAEVVGGSVLYAVGYFGGLPFVHRYGKYVFFREHELERVHAFYARYGRLTVFWCRFLPFVRGIAALPAGLSRMPKRYFLSYTALGSAIFCFGLSYLGQYAGKNIDSIMTYVHESALVIVAVTVVVIVAAFIVWRVTKKRGGSKDIAT
jgi:membrane protein DedA with SNARE-associated domain